MPLGLVPRVRTQDMGWAFQEVHHCATHVMVRSREQIFRTYIYGLNDKAINGNGVVVFQFCVGAYLYPNNHSKGPVRRIVIERKLRRSQ